MRTRKIDFQKLYKSHWTETEHSNLQIVIDFVQGILDHKFDKVIDKYSDSPYVQHNRSIESGVTAIVNFNRKLAKQFPNFFLEPKQIFIDGDCVIFHSHVTIKAKHWGNDRKGLNVIDVWKIADRRIVEHWDSIQPLDFMQRFIQLITGGFIRNNNGVF